LVIPSGEVSNLFHEDYEAVLKFMNAEIQKKKIKLWVLKFIFTIEMRTFLNYQIFSHLKFLSC